MFLKNAKKVRFTMNGTVSELGGDTSGYDMALVEEVLCDAYVLNK